jgi:hypothetical protein
MDLHEGLWWVTLTIAPLPGVIDGYFTLDDATLGVLDGVGVLGYA